MLYQTVRFWLLFGFLALLVACTDESTKGQYVAMSERGFTIGDSAFDLLALNYIIPMQFDGHSLWPSSYQDHNPGKRFTHTEKEDCLAQIRNELMLMKEQGINTVRVVQLAENVVTGPDSLGLFVHAYDQDAQEAKPSLTDLAIREQFIQGIVDFLDIAESLEMKVILLMRWRPGWQESATLMHEIAAACVSSKSLLAYDVFNEPLYFDPTQRTKKEVVEIMNELVAELRNADPNHLITIGLEGIREVFEWDPNFMPVDFISFHPYEYEPDQVRNELAWYGRHVHLPWIVGETSISADNDSVSYTAQAQFAQRTMEQACACGSKGYSWWQYKDVDWVEFHPSYMGMVSIEGQSELKDGTRVAGSLKPVADVFRTWRACDPGMNCEFLPNYYNYSMHDQWKLTGRIVDQNEQPIEGAVVLGWNRWWDDSYHTITQEDGSFVLLSDFPIHHWMASATYHSMVRDDCDPRSSRQDENGIMGLDLGTLSVNRVNL